jgi:thiol-disulfide isomerase/thioredoxin
MRQFRTALAAMLAAALAGCGPRPAAAPEPTQALPETAACGACVGSDSTGAVCETPVDTTTAGDLVGRDTQMTGPAGEAEPVPCRQPAEAAPESGQLPAMWDFGSTTCIPCKTMKGILDPMMADYRGRVNIRIINVHDEQELSRRFRITVIPTQVFIDSSGKEIFRHVGVYPRDSIEARFSEFGMPVVTAGGS